MTYTNIFKSKLNIVLILTALVAFGFGLVAEVNAITCPACPEFNCDAGDLELLVVKNRTQSTSWQDPVSAGCGDRIAFQVYYRNCIEGSVANNTKIRIDYPDYDTTNIVTTGYLWAYDADYISDTGTVNVSTAQKLTFDSTAKWYPNQTTSNPTILSITQHYRSVEVNLGNIQGGWSYQGYVTFEATLSGCSTAMPTVDIKANGYDGTVTIPYNNSATLSWTSSNASSCSASNAWTGTKSTSGTETTGTLTYSRTYTITCTGSGGSTSDSVTVNTGSYSYPTVDIKANGYDGTVTIPYNNSATLSWTSSNASSCSASNAWTGTKSTSGTETTGSISYSRTYTITCTGSGGSTSDSVTVNTEGQTYTDFSVEKTLRNLSKGTAYSDLIYADPGEVLTVGIVVRAGNSTLYNVNVKDTLPSGLIFRGELKVDNISTSGDILNGLNIGTLSAGQQKTITFRADVASAASFTFGQTQLTNTALATSASYSKSDTAKVVVSRGAVAGAATEVSTGLTNNLFLDSFLLPLLATLLLIWLFRSRIVRFEEWLDRRKNYYDVYKSKKNLQFKIAKIKAKEFFNQKI
ncbi:MAG: DUF11 domain-containing protein [Candidatus Pacebacteria bacterium]|nr:DUF11 domain-containing protein [Candidatus Paceibacterota bacterium]